MFAEVLPNLTHLVSTFHYKIPSSLIEQLRPGHLVIIPFGKQRVQGVVVSLSDEFPSEVSEMKVVESLIEDEPVLGIAQLELAFWLADYYRARLSACVGLMLPPGISKRADFKFELCGDVSGSLTSRQGRLVDAIRARGVIRGRQLDRVLPRTDWRVAADQLMRRGFLARTSILDSPSISPRTVCTVRLAVGVNEAREAMPLLGRESVRGNMLRYLASIWPGEPVLEDFVEHVGCNVRNVRSAAARGWVQLLGHERIVCLCVSKDAAQKWIDRHGAVAHRQCELVKWLLEEETPGPRMCSMNTPLRVIRGLERQGILRHWVNPRRVRLCLNLREAEAKIVLLRKAQYLVGVLQYLIRGAGGFVDVKTVYSETGCRFADLSELSELGLVQLGEMEVFRDSISEIDFAPDEPPELVDSQREVWTRIKAAFDNAVVSRESIRNDDRMPYLLHGVTGSGKTEIYLRAVAEALSRGLRSIVLVPEISLTPQIVSRFLGRFRDRVAIVHSQLSDRERFDTWRRARAGAIDVVIGARSALFAPLTNLGLIVVDEEHDEAYRQDHPVGEPYYSARDVAIEYAQRVGAVCILGSATPDIVSYWRAENSDMYLVNLPNRIMSDGNRIGSQVGRLAGKSIHGAIPTTTARSRFISLPRVNVVDMRHELRAGHRSIFSRSLIDAMTMCLSRGEQLILFINRRGEATYVFCRDCGKVMECGKCGIPFTYHGSSQLMICHHCNARRGAPKACLECKSSRVKFFGVGTEGVENEVVRMFPGVRTLRWDRDSTRERGAHSRILKQFSERDADILVGTQMIAKGLDLPFVTLVGVVSADLGLALPDYRAAERTFQVLTQVAGRAGRGYLGGRVVLQTYMPKHYAIQAAARHDYQGFYDSELEFRREQGYPPFGKLIRFVGGQRSADQVENEARKLTSFLRARMREERAADTRIIGPAPCFYQRLAGRYRWQVVLRGGDPAAIVDVHVPVGWRVEVDPLNLL